MRQTITFDGPTHKQEVKFRCSICGKDKKRTLSETHTVNPFNKDENGIPKNASRVNRDCLAALAAKVKAFAAHPACASCEASLEFPARAALFDKRAAAQQPFLDPIKKPDFEALLSIEAAAELVEQITKLKAEDAESALVAQDIERQRTIQHLQSEIAFLTSRAQRWKTLTGCDTVRYGGPFAIRIQVAIERNFTASETSLGHELCRKLEEAIAAENARIAATPIHTSPGYRVIEDSLGVTQVVKDDTPPERVSP